MSHFEYRKIKHVRFWIQGKQRIIFSKKKFTTHHILKLTFFVWSDSEIKTSQHVRFWTDEKDIASDFELKRLKPVRFCSISFTTCQILKRNFFLWSDFQLNFVERVRFWIKSSKTCQIFIWRRTTHHFLKLKNFDMSYFKRVRRNKSHLFFFLRENNRLSNFRDFLKRMVLI